jgi:hypothetical protein
MNINNNTDEFSNITNTWKQIFADFIEFIINDHNNTCGLSRDFEELRNSEADPNSCSKTFLEVFTFYIYLRNEYIYIFKQFVFAYFNELEFQETRSYTMLQYLQFLCVRLGTEERYQEYYNQDITTIEPNEKEWFCNYLIILTSAHFAKSHADFIEETFNNLMNPQSYLK